MHTVRHKERRFGVGCVEDWRRRKTELRLDADRLLERFESLIAKRDFLFGDAPVYGDFALFGIIGNMTYRGFNRLSKEQSALKAWQARLGAFRY